LTPGAPIRSGSPLAIRIDPERYTDRQLPTDTDALLAISAAIHSTRDLETLEKHLLEIVSRTLFADRGAILLLGESGEQFASVCGS
jgi:hypothetical protein